MRHRRRPRPPQDPNRRRLAPGTLEELAGTLLVVVGIGLLFGLGWAIFAGGIALLVAGNDPAKK